ncbi:hypothetical protein F4820DRAFT_86325 [Hypoxylon rubiginosum]|uniref:Uncharacterized protein n=1 Tax=Hypoxylon rubiginosum TaxID=110542 RepID=A0ACB9YPG5_9PEZI|nr:hypothetical protein F4820DRAFT_86325 [Hypoxylon rubiginosum]
MTAITKVTRGVNGMLTTLTYELPSQTTPFAPSRRPGDEGTGVPSQCAISVFCRQLFYGTFTSKTAAHDAHPLAGLRCQGVQATTDGAGWEAVGFEATCWPTNYFALFDYEWGVLNGANELPPTASIDSGDVPTAAFPGDRCLAGWTTACTTTVTAGASPLLAYYPQAWCCPPGRWSCATATADDDPFAPQRLCRSLLLVDSSTLTSTEGESGSAPPETEIWLSWDPPHEMSTRRGGGGGGGGSGDGWSEVYTWKAEVPGETDPAYAATVFRKVFPLVLSSGGGTGRAEGADATETEAVRVAVTEVAAIPAAAMPRAAGRSLFGDGDAQLLSRGAVAGFLGAAAAAVAMSFLGFGLWRRARRNRRDREAVTATAALREDGKYEVEILLKPEDVKLA